MELHNALRNIVQTDGKEILKDVRLVNILDDFNAYQDIPASKYILRAIIADGYTGKLLMIGKWDIRAETLVQKFSTITGFIPELVSLIFQSIAFGLGWINSINVENTENNQNQQKPSQVGESKHSRKQIPTGWRNDMTEDEKEEYLFSILEYDDSNEQQFHVKLENLSFELGEDDAWIEIHCEFNRIGRIPINSYTNLYLYYALYDLKGRMRDSGMFNYMSNQEPNPKPVSEIWYKPKASQLSKIRLFWKQP